MGEILPPIATSVKKFAIIGTREPDKAQEIVAYHLAFVISSKGYVVTTGAADGIDTRAMQGTRGKNLEVYLPWASYNRGIIPPGARIIVFDPAKHAHWTASVKKYHPNPWVLSRGALALHARNYGIIEEVCGVIALPGDNGSGGTSQGIRLARAKGIPVIQGNRGTITDAPRFIGRSLQQLGIVDSDLPVILPGRLSE